MELSCGSIILLWKIMLRSDIGRLGSVSFRSQSGQPFDALLNVKLLLALRQGVCTDLNYGEGRA